MRVARCANCGYDITGLSTPERSRVRCPECGEKQPLSNRPNLDRPPRLRWAPLFVGAGPNLIWVLIVAGDIQVRSGWTALEAWMYGSGCAAAIGAAIGAATSATMMSVEDRRAGLRASGQTVFERFLVAGVEIGITNAVWGYTVGFVALAITHGRLIC